MAMAQRRILWYQARPLVKTNFMKMNSEQSFARLIKQDIELSGARTEYARKPKNVRRAAAERVYDESVALSLFGSAVARSHGRELFDAKWPRVFFALAIDPEYAPALLTVGCHEYGSGRKSEGMGLFLQLTQLAPDTPDWIEIIGKAGDYLMSEKDHVNTCRLYEEALKVCPEEQEFIIGMGWALCHAGRQVESLPWLKKAIANNPEESALLSDYGWALAELGRFDEAQAVLEKAVETAPSGYDLPANNLARLQQMRDKNGGISEAP